VTGHTTGRIAPYTDLLLHDLGPGLADPSPAPDAAEWRTAPLWGLRSRRAFLHDGRAASPREAVLWHGGEAAASRGASSPCPPPPGPSRWASFPAFDAQADRRRRRTYKAPSPPWCAWAGA
jgi:hypothetical protein